MASRARQLSKLLSSDLLTVDVNNSRIGVNSTAPEETLDVRDSLTVGFDTSTTNRDLHVYSDLGTPVRIETTDTTSTIDFMDSGTSSTFNVRVGSEGDNLFLKSEEDTTILTGSGAGTEKLRITSTGRVGIGTNAPSSAIDVFGDITISNGSQENAIRTNADGQLQFLRNSGSNNQITVTIDDDTANVGVGSTIPNQAGVVIAEYGGDAFANTNLALKAYSATNYLRVTRNGTSGTGLISITYNYERTGSNEYTVDEVDVDRSAISFHPTDGIKFYYSQQDGTKTPGNPDEILQIDENGIQLAQNKGINFYNYGSGTNVNNNFLDDYEEGTWVPVYEGSVSNPTVTYDIQGGRYVKIGRVVHCEGRLRTDAATGGSGNLIINGLPFTSAPESTVRAGIDIGVIAAFGTNRPTEGLIRNNDTSIDLFRATTSSYANILTSDLSNTTNDNSIQFSVTYMAAS